MNGIKVQRMDEKEDSLDKSEIKFVQANICGSGANDILAKYPELYKKLMQNNNNNMYYAELDGKKFRTQQEYLNYIEKNNK